MDTENIDHILTRNIDTIYPSKEEFQKALEKETLTFYIGIDPNVPDVHLGHAVVYHKLEEFRKLGHKVIFLIGDFTARIGDPTDKSATRTRLTDKEVKENAKEYQRQISKVLSFDDPDNPAEMKFNSEWLANLSFEDLIELSANFTVQQMIERDMFEKRLDENKPIYLHEFFYPIMQGYDSVAMDVDVEVGGTDQMFNMLTGRTLLKALKDKEKFVITCQFLMGTDGKKMSKSTGNYISLRDEPFEMYRKVMTIHDDMIVHYFDMALLKTQTELEAIEKELEATDNPMDVKKQLAREVVTWIYDETRADSAQTEFEDVVQKGEDPDEIESFSWDDIENSDLPGLLNEIGLVKSKSQARRLIEQGAVRIDGDKITDINHTLQEGSEVRINVGKSRYADLR